MFRCTNTGFQKELICSRTGNLLRTCSASTPLRWARRRWRMGRLLEAIPERWRALQRGRHVLQHQPLQSPGGLHRPSACCSSRGLSGRQWAGLQSTDPADALRVSGHGYWKPSARRFECESFRPFKHYVHRRLLFIYLFILMIFCIYIKHDVREIWQNLTERVRPLISVLC